VTPWALPLLSHWLCFLYQAFLNWSKFLPWHFFIFSRPQDIPRVPDYSLCFFLKWAGLQKNPLFPPLFSVVLLLFSDQSAPPVPALAPFFIFRIPFSFFFFLCYLMPFSQVVSVGPCRLHKCTPQFRSSFFCSWGASCLSFVFLRRRFGFLPPPCCFAFGWLAKAPLIEGYFTVLFYWGGVFGSLGTKIFYFLWLSPVFSEFCQMDRVTSTRPSPN